MKKIVYIDLNPLLNSPAWLREAITERGDGKTTALIKAAYSAWECSGLPQIMLRRYKGEMGVSWQNDILTKLHEFAPRSRERELVWKGSFTGKSASLRLIDAGTKETIFECFPISITARKFSGLDVKTHGDIWWDEYVPHDGKYFPYEETLLFSLYQTVDRKTYTRKITLCGNPRFGVPRVNAYLHIDTSYSKTALKLFKDDTVAILTKANKGNIERELQSPFAKALAGTEFEGEMRGEGLGFKNLPIWTGKRTSNHNIYFFDVEAEIYIQAAIHPDAIVLSQAHKKPPQEAIYSLIPTFKQEYIYTRKDLQTRDWLVNLISSRGIFFLSSLEAQLLAPFALNLIRYK